ncbi:MAG: hypothetical protein HGA82_03525 [Anaerolineales bacterium]|nr:hypothetical protein [Anaerolineales bacterium]
MSKREWDSSTIANSGDRSKAFLAFQIEPRYPFCDRQLVEICLALPPTQKFGNGWPRRVLREAMTASGAPRDIWDIAFWTAFSCFELRGHRCRYHALSFHVRRARGLLFHRRGRRCRCRERRSCSDPGPAATPRRHIARERKPGPTGPRATSWPRSRGCGDGTLGPLPSLDVRPRAHPPSPAPLGPRSHPRREPR